MTTKRTWLNNENDQKKPNSLFDETKGGKLRETFNWHINQNLMKQTLNQNEKSIIFQKKFTI